MPSTDTREALAERLLRQADAIAAKVVTGNDWPNTQEELDLLNAASLMRKASAALSSPPAQREPVPLFRYDGPIYVRPCERGIVLTDLNGVDLESAVGEGDYYIAVRIYSAAATRSKT